MKIRARFAVLALSTPLIVLVLVGGFLNRVASGQQSYQPLRVFGEVVELVMGNYVERVDPERAMHGALRGLTDGLDADSAWLPAAQAATAARATAPPRGRRSRSTGTTWSTSGTTAWATTGRRAGRSRRRSGRSTSSG